MSVTDFTKPVAVVTGAARGIGLEVAAQLARTGMRVALTARRPAAAETAAGPLLDEGLDIVPAGLDIASEPGVRDLTDRIEAEIGRVDVLVGNAAAPADWAELPSTADLTAVRRTLDVNLLGTWRVVQALLPALRRSPHPRVVLVSSGAGSHGDPVFGLTTAGGTRASYGISKAAVNALTAKLASELEGTGILVNAVCPGLTATAPGMEEMGARPVAEGAAGIVWAATLPDGGPSGCLFRDGAPLSW
jgi:NAD(P)-dependent dehydrogenase (short-subunit alcohol dehydrogenase family)